MKVTQTFTFPHPVEKVAAVMRDPEFNVEIEKLRDGVVSTEFKVISETDREAVFELRTVEYKRKKTGGLDTSGTVRTYTTSRYDVARRRLSWEYHGEGGAMFSLGGVYALTPIGDESTKFTHEVTIEVKIPIIGKQIAKMIAKDFETRDDRYERAWKKYLDRSESRG